MTYQIQIDSDRKAGLSKIEALLSNFKSGSETYYQLVEGVTSYFLQLQGYSGTLSTSDSCYKSSIASWDERVSTLKGIVESYDEIFKGLSGEPGDSKEQCGE